MEYELVQAEFEDQAFNAFRQTGRLAKKFSDAPTVNMGLGLYYNAYFELNNSRGGMGDGPIPWLVVHHYARANGFDEEQEYRLHFFINSMDATYFEIRKRKTS